MLSSAALSAGEQEAAQLIVAVACSSDRVAFARLFTHFAPRVKTYLLRVGTTPAIAEDLAQETMLTVWRKAAFFDPARAGAAAWVFTIARNLRIDVLRREHHAAALVEAPPDPSPEPPRADALLTAAERERRVRAALVCLSSEQAEVVRLSFFQDKPHAEIERELGIPLGTVKSRLRLAMMRLRLLLDDDA